ncbi:hypothetical protein HNP37_001482 [Flavobacterium nitrogenifigens]|uniref:DUF5780 domain-containing protein n=2 Tax=Flavobacterium TaxID=237 RepID=A0A7W7N7I4_9FLAO|nr:MULTISPECIES: hypothetical protein [Flavobacterium]MBB4801421.1 hypothetical protein [Flavobacterium nitrogenifigens]MBB6386378.1 hypothetical protein [Flavobacterium notoginsengisoli]
MKKIALLVFSTLFLFSKCDQSKQEKKAQINSEKYSIEDESKGIQTDTLLTKKITSKIPKSEEFPIKILNATLLKNSYSHHKDIKITYKNLSSKSIKAIKLNWFCLNAFEEPASGNYFYGEGNFKGNIIDLIKPGQTKSEIWEDFSTDADKIIHVTVYYIVYNDGTKWKLQKDKTAL